MKAIRIHQQGGTEVMVLEELPTPTPAAGEALVRLDASGVNFLDIRQRNGDFKIQPPITLGNEGAGVVESVGPDPADITVGQRVGWQMQLGSYATHAVVPVDALVPLPDTITTRTAAAIMLQGLTAHALARSAYPVTAGETCLVYSAAGGVGGLLTQIAKLHGARVIGAVSSQAKAKRARDAGADEVIVYTEEDLPDAARRLTDGRGVDVVYDAVGRDTFTSSLDALRPLGYLISFGQSSGAIEPFDTTLLSAGGGRYLTRAANIQFLTDRAQVLSRANELFDWVATGAVHVHIGETFPLASAGLAHDAMSSRKTEGKLLLEIA